MEEGDGTDWLGEGGPVSGVELMLCKDTESKGVPVVLPTAESCTTEEVAEWCTDDWLGGAGVARDDE